MIAGDSNLLQPDPRKAKVSYCEDDLEDVERIKIKPSTELIPDEYENNKGNGAVYIFRAAKKTDTLNTESLLDTFSLYGYQIPSENLYFIETKRQVELNLKAISEKDFTDQSCLIIIFLGEIETDDNFIPRDDPSYTISTKDVWIHFINCRSLKHKPKIFIFQASKKYEKKVAVDAHVFYTDKQEYDIPSEADILIVYKKIDGPGEARLKFINELCENFKKFGQRDDIIGMVTHTDHTNEKRPLIISTLTRKFFITGSTHRDHFLDIDVQQDYVMRTISELQKKIAELEEHDEKRRKLKSTSSFRKIVNKFTRIGNNNSNSSTEETTEVDSTSKKDVKRSSTQKSSSQATTSLTFTDSAAASEKKTTLRKQSSPRLPHRKSSTTDPPKHWRP